MVVRGAVWLAVGLTSYVLYRRRRGLSLTETTKIVMPKPTVTQEVEYQSILVGFEDGHYEPTAVRTAVRLAARRRRGIHVIATITVPASVPIDAPLPDQERRAQEMIDSARVIGGRRVTGHYEKVRAGQAGRRIVDKARSIDARAIVMPRPRKRPGATLFGRTLDTVLEERPCRVIIESEPSAAGRAHNSPGAAGLSPIDSRPGGAHLVLGVAILVSTLARGGGPLALGVLVGAAFALLGAGRVYLARDR